MGAFLIPVSKSQIENSYFESDGKTIIHVLYSFESIDLIKSLPKLRRFIVEQDDDAGKFVYHPVTEGIRIVKEVESELEDLVVNSSLASDIATLLEDLLVEIRLLQQWLKSIGPSNSFYLLIA